MTSFMLETPLYAAIPNWIWAVRYIDLVAIGVFLLFALVVWVFRSYVPKIGAIAWVTFKETVSQPLFLILVLIGLFALFIFLYIPYHTLGEDLKLVITQGLTLIKLMAIFLAVWTASFSVAEELEGKTALMILAKPVSRLQFILGKYSGVVMAVTLIFLILGFFFLNTVSYKVVFDARESAKDVPTALDCTQQVMSTLPSFALSFLETLILTAIAIAISTRLSLLPNLTICLAVYVIGHLAPMIVQSSVGQIAFVAFVADLACAVLPVLEHFNMETNVAMGQPPTWWYVFCTAIYAVMYSGLALVFGLFLFEDRDLA